VGNCTVFYAIGIEYRVHSIELERKVVEREYNFHLIVAAQQVILMRSLTRIDPALRGILCPRPAIIWRLSHWRGTYFHFCNLELQTSKLAFRDKISTVDFSIFQDIDRGYV
jgi:hypothetical protein